MLNSSHFSALADPNVATMACLEIKKGPTTPMLGSMYLDYEQRLLPKIFNFIP